MKQVYITFSPEQLASIANAYHQKKPITLPIRNTQLAIPVSLTQVQLDKINSNQPILLSNTTITKIVNILNTKYEKHGGFLPAIAALLPFIAKAATVAIPAATGIAGAIATKSHNDKMLAEAKRQTQLLQNTKGSGLKLRKGSGIRLSKNLKKNSLS